MFKAFVVEDEANILNYIKRIIQATGEIEVIGAYGLPEDALANFSDMLPEVVFLDIEMPGMNGVDLAKKLLAIKNDLMIVFLTAYAQYAVNAFELEAVDYLLKPIVTEDLIRVIKRLHKNRAKTDLKWSADVKNDYDSRSNSVLTPPVRCLGSFEVKNLKNQLVRWPTKKSEEVFAYLLVNKGVCVSKWNLLDRFWQEYTQEKGMNNLYSTMFRIKAVIKELPCNPQINIGNAGYILTSEEGFSDLEVLKACETNTDIGKEITIQQKENIYYNYKSPLFGDKDYLWSLSYQEDAINSFRKLYLSLLRYYVEKQDMDEIEKTIRHFVSQHCEEEVSIKQGLSAMKSVGKDTDRIRLLIRWINKKLEEQEMPDIEA
jgi:two-component system, LytTR family, response regulator